MFSRSCKYGLKAMVYIATNSFEGKNVMKIKEVAENSNLPVAFTAKLMGILSKHNLIQSQTGPNGGFYLEQEKLHEIKLSQIVQAIDGDFVYKGCGLGLNYCDIENPCPLHDDFKQIRDGLKNMLESTSIYDLAIKVKQGQSFLSPMIDENLMK